MRQRDEISSVLTVNVRPDKVQAYEQWLEHTRQILEQQDGFVGMEVLRPSNDQHHEYLILVRFANKTLLDRWRQSAVFAQLRAQSQVFILTVERAEQQFGTEMFFSRPVSNIQYPKPPFWKQMVIGVLTVYPIILVANGMVRPLMKGFNPLLTTFFMVCMVSPSMIFLMPRVSKLFRSWLYQTPSS